MHASLAQTATSSILVEDQKKSGKQITNVSVLDQNDFLYMELLGQGACGKVRKSRSKQAGW